MSAEPTLEELLEVQAYFRLPSPALVEKDFYVVKALAAIAAVEKEALHVRLVFGGGTALSRAHRLNRRMSEDIDLRIVVDSNRPGRGTLRRLAHGLPKPCSALDSNSIPTILLTGKPATKPATRSTAALTAGSGAGGGLAPDDPDRNGGVAIVPPGGRAAGDLVRRRSPTAAIGGRGDRVRVDPRTAADKFVALTRRAGAELAGLVEAPDLTLVRHLHDLHVLREYYDPAEAAALARENMLADATAYGNQFPAYRENPMRETLRAVEGLAGDAGYARQYGEFERLMVYGNAGEYGACVGTPRELADSLQLATA